MASYAANRLLPNRSVVAGRQQHASSVPGTAASRWTQASQARRIVRWLVSRPGRPDTLAAVDAALAQEV